METTKAAYEKAKVDAEDEEEFSDFMENVESYKNSYLYDYGIDIVTCWQALDFVRHHIGYFDAENKDKEEKLKQVANRWEAVFSRLFSSD